MAHDTQREDVPEDATSNKAGETEGFPVLSSHDQIIPGCAALFYTYLAIALAAPHRDFNYTPAPNIYLRVLVTACFLTWVGYFVVANFKGRLRTRTRMEKIYAIGMPFLFFLVLFLAIWRPTFTTQPPPSLLERDAYYYGPELQAGKKSLPPLPRLAHGGLSHLPYLPETVYYTGANLTSDDEVAAFCAAYRTAMEAPTTSNFNPAQAGLPPLKPVLSWDEISGDAVKALRERQSRFAHIPLLIQDPLKGEGEVVYLDGHYARLKYPGPWPMTERTIGLLREANALQPNHQKGEADAK